MPKGWAALPRNARWFVVAAAVVIVLAVIWALFVPLADWLAHHDVGSASGPLHETALDDARGRLLTLGAGLLAAGALIFTARNFTLSRHTFELTEQGQVTDRYTQAIGQLGSDKLDVRIGGIYALERVARDSARDRLTVIEVLSAFIREHSHEPWPPPDLSGRGTIRSLRPDVQAAVTVLGRREIQFGDRYLDLAGADLAGAEFGSTKIPQTDFRTATLVGASFSFADVTSAILVGADLTNANFQYADLRSAILADTNVGNAILVNTKFDGAHLDGVLWPRTGPVPEGWKLDAQSGLLQIWRAWEHPEPGSQTDSPE